jgi:hypothetical protein
MMAVVQLILVHLISSVAEVVLENPEQAMEMLGMQAPGLHMFLWIGNLTHSRK